MEPVTLEACYKTLGLTSEAKFDEIKHAYRTLAKHWHPDRFATDADRQRQALEHFHAITHAYAMLRAYRVAADLSYAHGGWRRRGVRALAWVGRGARWLGLGGLIIIGCYAFQATFGPAAPSALSTRLPGGLAQSISTHAYITIGSTYEAVRAIHGTPTWATDRLWEYGGSRLYFQVGRVIGWDIWPGSPLKVHLSPSVSLNPVPASFTVGSTKDEVLAVPGHTNQSDRTSVGIWGVTRVFY